MLKVRKGTQQNVNTWTGGGARVVCEYRYTTRCRHLNLTSSRDIGKVLLACLGNHRNGFLFSDTSKFKF